MRQRIFILTTLSTLAVIVAACGIPKSTPLERVDANDPLGLSLTTSSTTTTTLAPTTVASTVVEATSSTTPPETTAVTGEIKKLYFIANDRLFAVGRELIPNVSRDLILTALAEGITPEENEQAPLRTLIPGDAIRNVIPQGGVAAIELSADFVASLATQTPQEQALAWGQLVLTTLQGESIGQVIFTVDGAPIQVLNGILATQDSGRPMSVEDYANLLATDG